MVKSRDMPLQEASLLINKDRNNEYGEPHENFMSIANMLNELLKPVLAEGAKLGPEHVTMIMMAVKLSRMVTSPTKFDTYVDICGYAAVGWEAVRIEEAKNVKKR